MARDTDAPQEQHLCCQVRQIPHRPHRVLQVVEKPIAKDKIKLADLLDGGVFDIQEVELDFRISSPRFLNVLLPTIHAYNFKTRFPEETREVANATTNIECGLEFQSFFDLSQETTQPSLACLDKNFRVRLIENESFRQWLPPAPPQSGKGR
ncbi:MAG TPA: hypothetical protein VGT03_06220 [Candidatus Acidoferrales bacterium]|nr:hypothetical protein [Candidatus Acidoferrales bacterium]